jgi:hypothetical protein
MAPDVSLSLRSISRLKLIWSQIWLKPLYVSIMESDSNLCVHVVSSENIGLLIDRLSILRPTPNLIRPLNREESLLCNNSCDMGSWFFRLIRMSALFSPSYDTNGDVIMRTYSNLDPYGSPFSCLLHARHAKGCWGFILTSVFTSSDKRDVICLIFVEGSLRKF